MRPDYLLALGTGLLGGLGHCVGMCGPLVGAVSLAAAPALGPRRVAAGQVLYNLGRVTTYSLVGALMGLTGSFVNVAGRLAGFQQTVAVAAGLLLIAMGLGAAATGGLAPGLLFALCFALGTVPALLLVGWATAVLGHRLRGALYRAGGVLVVLLGALFVARGLGLHAAL